MKTEVAPGYAKHGNAKTEVAATIAEVAPFDFAQGALLCEGALL
ncbi:hypothetical protein [Nostoc sp. NMS2]|nr:hypothetical protein [Nostoc sp. NMS2]